MPMAIATTITLTFVIVNVLFPFTLFFRFLLILLSVLPSIRHSPNAFNFLCLKPNSHIFASKAFRLLRNFLPIRFSNVEKVVGNRDSVEPKIILEQAMEFCDRNFGIGADRVIFALLGINSTDYTTRIFNYDGCEPEVWISSFGIDAKALIKKLDISKERGPRSQRKLTARDWEKPAKHISPKCSSRFIQQSN